MAEQSARYGTAIIADGLGALEVEPSKLSIYDREIGVRALYENPQTGVEHYLIRYPAGLRTRRHRHSHAHTFVVLEGRLKVNDQVIGPGAYCHVPAGEAMRHEPADGAACLFVAVFDGPVDMEPLEE